MADVFGSVLGAYGSTAARELAKSHFGGGRRPASTAQAQPLRSPVAPGLAPSAAPDFGLREARPQDHPIALYQAPPAAPAPATSAPGAQGVDLGAAWQWVRGHWIQVAVILMVGGAAVGAGLWCVRRGWYAAAEPAEPRRRRSRQREAD